MREGVPAIINPNDINGLEEALQIREKHGGSITAISMGPPQAIEVLKYALAMGVDRAILLTDRLLGGSDTLATGYALSEVIKGLEFDLVICGLEALDGCTGQVGPIIAENLNIPQLTYVKNINIKDSQIFVHRELGQGYQVLKAKLPVMVSVLPNMNKPRRPADTKEDVIVKDISAMGIDVDRVGIKGSPTRVVNIRILEQPNSYVNIDSSLSADERIKAIINGGMKAGKKVKLERGTPKDLAKKIYNYPYFEMFLEDKDQ